MAAKRRPGSCLLVILLAHVSACTGPGGPGTETGSEAEAGKRETVRSEAMPQEKTATPVTAAERDGKLVLGNGLVTVRFDAASGTFAASVRASERPDAAGGEVEFIRSGRVGLDSREGREGAGAAIVDVGTRLGDGKAVEVKLDDGSAVLVALYPGLPFVCFTPRLVNTGDRTKVVDKITPAVATVDLGKAPGDLRVLGCDGLVPADGAKTGHTFLAAADPKTRAGVVAGWITHHRGSGVVCCEPEGDALRFSGRCEYGKLRVEPGAAALGETFVMGRFEDALDGLEIFADAAATANEVKLRPVTSGYCTWYHARALDEKRMATLADFCGEHLTKFGFGVLQIDDKWQVSGRDFTAHRGGGPYRSGMKATAEKITSRGMTAGIWYIPFGWDPKRPAFKEHQDWFVKREDGSLYAVRWAGTCLDMTHPGAREFLRGVVERMTKDWGYKYMKVDGLWTGLAARITYPSPVYRDDKLGDAVFHDPAKTNLEAYRDGLKLVREAAGDDVFILGCNIAQNMRTLGASFGRVDGMRVGADIGAKWGSILRCMVMGARLYFLNGRVWYNDPDCLMLRSPLTLDQARAWGSWIAVSGQLNIVSEWLPGLPPEKLEVVKRTMPNHGLCGRPVDLFETDKPRVWHLASDPALGRGDTRRDIIALFNWDEKKPATVKVDLAKLDLAKLDLPGGEGATYVGFDYWADTFVPPFAGALEADLAPSSCRVIALRPALERPLVVSTSRHVTQGVVDLAGEKWDAGAKALSGRSAVVAGDPYEVRIVARSSVAVSAEVSAADAEAGVTAELRQSGPHVRFTVRSATSREVAWKVLFRPGVPERD